jgi:hypothetical protein
MPPHCDTLDGPVVRAARKALDARNVNLALAYAPEDSASEIRSAFDKVQEARRAGGAAREVADRYFFETVVRLHRAGEGAPFTGLKPAGLDEGPVIPMAEKAIESGSPDALIGLLTDTLRQEIQHRFKHMMRLRNHATDDVGSAREYVEAMLGLQVYSHQLYLAMKSHGHAGTTEHRHD